MPDSLQIVQIYVQFDFESVSGQPNGKNVNLFILAARKKLEICPKIRFLPLIHTMSVHKC